MASDFYSGRVPYNQYGGYSVQIGSRAPGTATYQNQGSTALAGRQAPISSQLQPPTLQQPSGGGLQGYSRILTGAQSAAAGNPAAQGQQGAYQQLLSQYGNLYGAGRQAQQTNYAEILRGYQDRYKRNLGYLDTLGEDERRDIERRTTRETAVQNQGLISRGLGNTTIRASVSRGIEEDRGRRIADLNQRILSARVGIDAPLSADALRFQERDPRTAYPQFADVGNFALQAGSQGYGVNLPQQLLR